MTRRPGDPGDCKRGCKMLRYGGILILFIPAIVNVLVGAMVRINSLNCTKYDPGFLESLIRLKDVQYLLFP